ncbi:hypothetical protein ABZ498_06625 [Streptomyces lavendulocolor]|uniref:hypothetical protein n=1 Tax=Streptomyces lavendulocolor TaxID=67316 RepID=UPI003401698E
MIIVYAPVGGETEQYDARTLKVSEASICSRTADMKWGAIKQGIADEDLESMRVVVWVLKRRSQPSLRYGDFDPGVEELYSRFDRDEIAQWVNGAVSVVEASQTGTAQDLVKALAGMPSAALDREHAEALIQKAVEEFEPGPKEEPAEDIPTSPHASLSTTSAESEPSTSASSPTS